MLSPRYMCTCGESMQNQVEKEKPLVAGHFLNAGTRRPDSIPWKKKKCRGTLEVTIMPSMASSRLQVYLGRLPSFSCSSRNMRFSWATLTR